MPKATDTSKSIETPETEETNDTQTGRLAKLKNIASNPMVLYPAIAVVVTGVVVALKSRNSDEEITPES